MAEVIASAPDMKSIRSRLICIRELPVSIFVKFATTIAYRSVAEMASAIKGNAVRS